MPGVLPDRIDLHEMRGTEVAAQQGGRRRATKQDVFRDALVAALAGELDVDPDRLTVSAMLDGEPVSAAFLPVSLELAAERGTEVLVGVARPVAGPAEVDDDEPAAKVPAREGARTSSRASGRASAQAEDGPDAGGGPVAGRRPSESDASREVVAVTPEELDEEAEAAADLLEGLLDAMDLPGDLRISVQEAHAEVEVIGLEEGVLIGRRGQTLDAVQELVRTAMQRRFERRSRVLVDVDGYRARRLEKLLERADEAVQEVLASGEAQRLEPMDSIERRLVHQRVADTAGVVSNSHGREPSRRIVIELAD